jgi:hypothetical protein
VAVGVAADLWRIGEVVYAFCLVGDKGVTQFFYTCSSVLKKKIKSDFFFQSLLTSRLHLYLSPRQQQLET